MEEFGKKSEGKGEVKDEKGENLDEREFEKEVDEFEKEVDEKKFEKEIDIEHLFRLARIRLSDEEKEKVVEKIKGIFKLISKISYLPLEEVEPTFITLGEYQRLREDETKIFEFDVTLSFPRKRGGYLVVPKIIDK